MRALDSFKGGRLKTPMKNLEKKILGLVPPYGGKTDDDYITTELNNLPIKSYKNVLPKYRSNYRVNYCYRR